MRHLVFFLTFFSVLNLFSQQIPFFRSEIYSPQWHNPASYGTWSKFSVNAAGAGNFWSPGVFSGAFLGTTEGFIAPGNGNSGIGLGASYLYDYSPFTQSTGFNVAANYQYAFDKFNVSLGLAPGIQHVNFGHVSWTPHDSLTPLYSLPSGRQTKFMLNTGLYFFNDKFYAGISSVQTNAAFYDELNYQAAVHFFVNAGARYKISKNMQLFPSVIIGTDGAGTLVSGRVLLQFFKPGISIGAGFESSGRVNAVAGYEFKKFSFLYVSGFDTSELLNQFLLNHVVLLSYKIRREAKCSTCEYF